MGTFPTERPTAEGLILCPAAVGPEEASRASRSDSWLSGLYFKQSSEWFSERQTARPKEVSGSLQHTEADCEVTQQEGKDGQASCLASLGLFSQEDLILC